MILPDYLADVARELRQKSSAIRRDFATHRPSAGGNRESLVEQFLESHLPKRFGVSSGLIISHDGLFSNEADLVVVDHMHNAPLYGGSRSKLWPVEAVYSLLEIKTTLSPRDLRDAISKGRRFKRLQRRFCNVGQPPRIQESLFVIWAFEAPAPETVKANLVEALADVPRSEQPDFVIVPDLLVARSGSYLELSALGQPHSPHRQEMQQKYGARFASLLAQSCEVYALGENSLLGWYVWFDSWLRQVGPRLTVPTAYLPSDVVFGHRV